MLIRLARAGVTVVGGRSGRARVHVLLLMAIGLHGYGIEWRSALTLRDQLVRMANASDAQTASLHVEGGEASLVISIAGVPSFQIDTK
jgi:hypothetical protein